MSFKLTFSISADNESLKSFLNNLDEKKSELFEFNAQSINFKKPKPKYI